MKQLTKAEEEIMKAVWKTGGGGLMEIVEAMGEPPHKNTVASVLKTLQVKGFITIEPDGRFHRYLPAISREAYSTATLTRVAKGYFEGSFSNVVSFLLKENKLSPKELETLLR